MSGPGRTGAPRTRYTDEENFALVKFVIENQQKFRSFEIFVKAASEKAFEENKRTPHSLYNKFHKYIVSPWKTNAAQLSGEQILTLAERYKVKLADPIIKKLEEYFIIHHDDGLIKEFQTTPKGLALQLGQLRLEREAEVGDPHGAEVKDPYEAEEEETVEAEKKDSGEEEVVAPGEAKVVVSHGGDGEDPDGGKKECPDTAVLEASDEASNSLFEIIALLLGCLDIDVDFDSFDNQFTSLIEMYWSEDSLPTRRVTQRHLLLTIQAFLRNFDDPVQQEDENTVAFNGQTLCHLRRVHRSLVAPNITEQKLLESIRRASGRPTLEWQDENIYTDFTFPSRLIKNIITAIFAALRPEGFDA